jgi:CheY-like chemotaxis protein
MTKHAVLYADDSEADRLLVANAFKRAAPDVEFQTVASGDAVLSYLQGEGDFANRARHPLPALVLLDLRMGAMSGLDVVRWIRRHPEFATLVVICVSGSAEQAVTDAAYEAGVNSFIGKPSSLSQLEEAARTVCDYWLRCLQLPQPQPPWG